MAPLKILACGGVNGNFSKFMKRVNTIHKKNGPFEMVISCGNFFNPSSQCKENWKEVQKNIKLDVPVYILGPTSTELEQFYTKDKLQDGEELCENLLYLGRKGIFKTSSGLVIAYLSGLERSSPDSSFTMADISTLEEQAKREEAFVGVDILLTSSWPKNINKNVQTKISPDNPSGLVSSLAASIKPRYHVTCHGESFFERTPYRNHLVLREEQRHVTRFIALAPLNNPKNEKAVYAFVITPMSRLDRQELIKQPDEVTEFPYKEVLTGKFDQQSDTDQPQQFFFKNEDLKRKSNNPTGVRERKMPKGPPALSSACWFCLGSKGVEKHLVVSVGEQCYVALAKGALNEDNVLICPVAHHNSTVVSPDEVRMEMEKYKNGLRKMFAKEGKAMVIFERNFYTQHLQLQVAALPLDVSDDVKDTFLDLGESNHMEFIEVPDDKDITELVAITTPYFWVELPDGNKLLHKVKGRMSLQFGREVLASPSLLNIPDRIDWKKCKLSKEDESTQAKSFRKRFQPFDFNFS